MVLAALGHPSIAAICVLTATLTVFQMPGLLRDTGDWPRGISSPRTGQLIAIANTCNPGWGDAAVVGSATAATCLPGWIGTDV